MTDKVIERLLVTKEQLLAALENVDIALAEAGCYDLVTWAGPSSYEQRCHRCGYWIFLGDPIASVVTEGSRTVYIHRKHVIRPGPVTQDEGEATSGG